MEPSQIADTKKGWTKIEVAFYAIIVGILIAIPIAFGVFWIPYNEQKLAKAAGEWMIHKIHADVAIGDPNIPVFNQYLNNQPVIILTNYTGESIGECDLTLDVIFENAEAVTIKRFWSSWKPEGKKVVPVEAKNRLLQKLTIHGTWKSQFYANEPNSIYEHAEHHPTATMQIERVYLFDNGKSR